LACVLDEDDWSWINSTARVTPPQGLPGSAVGFPRAATWPVTRDQGLGSVSAVRASARAVLQRWGITERGDDIVLVLSELLANALLHARLGPGRWDVAAGLLQPGRDARVLCAVTDPGPDLPRRWHVRAGQPHSRRVMIPARAPSPARTRAGSGRARTARPRVGPGAARHCGAQPAVGIRP